MSSLPAAAGVLRDSRNLPSPDGAYHKASEDCAVSKPAGTGMDAV
ncbi:MAG TPA: hypothetical protein VGS06_29400 [Streptosporangiaceae bacterium]|nr:hypothetical protein [Streptosporangiaceae bacterium]